MSEHLKSTIHNAILRHIQKAGPHGIGPEPVVDERVVEEIASALPELSQLLGELAVAQKAVKAFDAYEQWWYEDGEGRFWCEFCEESQGESEDYIEHTADCPKTAARSALASDSGRLAGEMIRAMISEQQILDAWLAESESGNRSSDPTVEAWRRRRAAHDALLQAFPAIRGEVER